jgi:hypothetical protein
MREYGKRKYVPASCPECGVSRVDLATPRGRTLSDYLHLMHGTFHAILRKNDWGLWRWYGHCARCAFNASVYDDLSKGSVWNLIKKPAAGEGREMRFLLRTSYGPNGGGE